MEIPAFMRWDFRTRLRYTYHLRLYIFHYHLYIPSKIHIIIIIAIISTIIYDFLFSELHPGSFTGFVSTSKATQWWWTFFTRQCPTYQFLCVSGGDTRITVLLGLLVPEGGKGHCWWRMVFKLELLRASCIVIFNRSLYAGSSNIFLSCNFHAKLVCN